MAKILVVLGVAALAGCASAGPAQPDAPPRAMAACDAAAAQGHVGHTATAAMGGAILSDSGAATLRWGPPDSVWTMDYREDRVNVRYDRAMMITEIACG